MANHSVKIIIILSGILAVLVYFYSVTVSAADAGIGIYASTNAGTLTEGRESCITYKLYNPSGVDVTGALSPAGEIRNITTRTDPPILVPKGTSYGEGIERRICLKGKLLHAGCALGKLFCKTCTGDATYAGSVVASMISSTNGELMGSSSQPLRVTVLCGKEDDDPLTMSVLLVAVTLLIVGAFIFRKKKKAFQGYCAKKAAAIRKVK